ncbi:ABC transporter substrate-binding protein [Streptomyces sp. AcE210]|uniref:ABC transporter substrate-binding protein n=1 Tax=Streptomyces sp. AcE210 TaxID=2292703 RepID=UPI000E2FFC09|nr:ABC transporter substrate-binding protein [Streptomyces sp. AcE210]RFC70801.1 ABC transporter substrate-binding protein [Streptomyces sp. AcE210]
MLPASRPRFPLARSALLAAALLTSTACMAGTTDSAGGSGGAPGPTVRIAVGVDPAYAPFFLADAKGLWAEHGVNVDLVQFAKGGEGVDALTAGQVQLAGNSDTTTIGVLAQSPSLRSLLVYESSGKYLKAVLGPHVKSPSRIRKMAVVPGLSELAATRFLESKGIDTDTVDFVTSDPAEIPALTKKGEVDGYVLWEPWPTKGKELGARVVATTGDYGVSYQQWLLATSPWLKANSDTAAKVAGALAQAARETERDPDAAARATKDAAKIPTAQTVQAIKEIDFAVRDFTAADRKAYRRTADFYAGTGKVSSRPDVSKAVLDRWLPEHTEGSR